MDSLDQIIGTAGPLLRRVDAVLAVAGAPAGHGLWAQLRRVRLLTVDAVYAVAALRPAALTEVAPELRSYARGYAAVAASLPAAGDWTGEAADAYDSLRRRVADHLDDDLRQRLEATAGLGGALRDWMGRCRGDLAATLAEVLGSEEAVVLSSAPEPGASGQGVPDADVVAAAAGIARRVLSTIADGQQRGTELLDGSAGLVAAQRAPGAHH